MLLSTLTRAVLLVIVCALAALWLSACGGGGSTSSDSTDADLMPSVPLSVIQTSPAFAQPAPQTHNIKIPAPVAASQAQ